MTVTATVLFWILETEAINQRGLNTKRPTLWLSQNVSSHLDRQARTGDTVLVKSRDMTGIGANIEEGRAASKSAH